MDVEDAPPSKFPRVERAIKITDIKMHSRLNIYDFVGYDVSLPYHGNDNDLYEPKDADNNAKMYGRMSFGAAIFGDLDALQYLNDIDENPLNPLHVTDVVAKMETICMVLARTQHWKGLEWAVEEGYSGTGYTIGGAIAGGANRERLEWLHDMGCFADKETFQCAAEYGNMEVMKWLREIGCPWDKDTFCEAVVHQNMDILKWLKKEGCPWNEEVFEKAAATGNLPLLLWLRVEGCPWDSRTFSEAVKGGADFFTLKWLFHEKCPWDKCAFIAAVERGDLEILSWLRENRCPWHEDVYDAALESRNGRVLQWLRNEKCPPFHS